MYCHQSLSKASRPNNRSEPHLARTHIMSWQSTPLPTTATTTSSSAAVLDASSSNTIDATSAWDAELFSDVAALLGPQMSFDIASDDDDENDSADLMDDDDLAILNHLLQSAQQHDAVRQQQQQPHSATSPHDVPAATTSSTPTALLTVASTSIAPPPPPPTTATASIAPTTSRALTKTTATATKSAVALTDPSDEIVFTGKTTRERRKEELAFLRTKALELEAKLAKLKQPMASASSDQCTDLVARPRQTLSRYAALWMKLAKRQDEERRHALTENAKLRQLVVAQVRLARSLDRVLRKRMVRAFACLCMHTAEYTPTNLCNCRSTRRQRSTATRTSTTMQQALHVDTCKVCSCERCLQEASEDVYNNRQCMLVVVKRLPTVTEIDSK